MFFFLKKNIPVKNCLPNPQLGPLSVFVFSAASLSEMGSCLQLHLSTGTFLGTNYMETEWDDFLQRLASGAKPVWQKRA